MYFATFSYIIVTLLRRPRHPPKTCSNRFYYTGSGCLNLTLDKQCIGVSCQFGISAIGNEKGLERTWQAACRTNAWGNL